MIAKRIAVIIVPVVVVGLVLGTSWQGIAGRVMYVTGAASLRMEARDTALTADPLPLRDDFAAPQPSAWRITVVDGLGRAVTSPPVGAFAHHVSGYHYDNGLVMTTALDTSFDPSRPRSFAQYNNVAYVSTGGYRPTPEHDVVMRCTFQLSENFWGTAGCLLQPVGTVRDDGTIASISSVGVVAVYGEEASLWGKSGVLCTSTINWWTPPSVQEMPVDPRQGPVQIEVRLRWEDERNLTMLVYADGAQYCRIDKFPIFGAEAHLWNDNNGSREAPWYQVFPMPGYQVLNGPDKWARYTDFSLGLEAAGNDEAMPVP
jgi:hypothetical protein